MFKNIEERRERELLNSPFQDDRSYENPIKSDSILYGFIGIQMTVS